MRRPAPSFLARPAKGRTAPVHLLVGLAPFILYCVLGRLTETLSLWLAFAAAFALAIDAFVETQVVRALDMAQFVLFGALALFDAFVQPGTPAATLALVIELGLFAMAAGSLVLGRPFTARYTITLLSRGAPATALPPPAHRLLAAAWAVAFALMAVCDATTVFIHRYSPIWTSTAGLVALASVLTFTWRFGVYIGRHGGSAPILGNR